MKDSPRHLVFIDYLRGVAILGVFLYHCFIAATGAHSLPWNWLTRSFDVPWWFFVTLPFHYGNIGVPIFFVVSGFCIHLSFEQQGRDWKSFFLRRFFRIYPAYIVAILMFSYFYTNLVSSYFPHQYTPRDFWVQFGFHALLIHNFFNSFIALGLGGAFWTIAVEVQLYLLYPVLLLLVAKWGWKSTMICLAACEIFLRVSDNLYLQVSEHLGSTFGFTPLLLLAKVSLFVHDYLEPSPLAYWFSWSLGALAADAFLKGRPMPLAKSSLWFWVFLVIVSYFLLPLWVHFFMLSALLTTRVIGFYLSHQSPRIKAPNFWMNQLRLTGVWSYSIYLLHAPPLEILSKVQQQYFPRINPLLGFLCFVSTWLIIFPLSGVWHRIFEQPGIALGKAIIRRMADKKSAIPVKLSDG